MQPPPIQIHQAQPVQVASVKDIKELGKSVADYSGVKQINSIAAGLVLGLIAAGVVGPAMMMASFGCIACGVCLGGLAGNSSRSFADALLFAVLLCVALCVAVGGVHQSLELQRKLDAIKF